jgi:hypothetical protein
LLTPSVCYLCQRNFPSPPSHPSRLAHTALGSARSVREHFSRPSPASGAEVAVSLKASLAPTNSEASRTRKPRARQPRRVRARSASGADQVWIGSRESSVSDPIGELAQPHRYIFAIVSHRGTSQSHLPLSITDAARRLRLYSKLPCRHWVRLRRALPHRQSGLSRFGISSSTTL